MGIVQPWQWGLFVKLLNLEIWNRYVSIRKKIQNMKHSELSATPQLPLHRTNLELINPPRRIPHFRPKRKKKNPYQKPKIPSYPVTLSPFYLPENVRKNLNIPEIQLRSVPGGGGGVEYYIGKMPKKRKGVLYEKYRRSSRA